MNAMVEMALLSFFRKAERLLDLGIKYLEMKTAEDEEEKEPV